MHFRSVYVLHWFCLCVFFCMDQHSFSKNLWSSMYSIKLQHDELKPLTKSFTDSLSELGNLKVFCCMPHRVIYFMITIRNWQSGSCLQLEHLPQDYNGSALTLIESLSRCITLNGNCFDQDEKYKSMLI